MKNNIGQMSTSTTFIDADPFVKIFDYIFHKLRLYFTNYASNVGFQGFNGLWIIRVDLIFHYNPTRNSLTLLNHTIKTAN